ncbi:MAG TPA: hypothetical protein VGO88_03800 [Mycetocola sp.]|jgi:hypothetical protein|uniref:hypothetical protein n=1 Tax=Mycetocola sp. TaxID=1871042 RepID=UPI00263764A4|nr:hypothetical protein [Mycetocola sp.]MCU1419294.1 hypothetical protein [Mycetocola sp.]MCU1560593.1 hypothetical protein [Mycetocola sp.]HEV7848433.1 hypothetical protein [Mycetocola sp.]
MDNYWLNALWSVIPTVLLGVIFWYVMRAIIRADRHERAAYADLEAAERSRLGLPPSESKGTDGSAEN